jgi:hypothetical protein
MINWWRNRKKRICVEKAEEITDTRRELESARKRLEHRESAFWSAPVGLALAVKGQYPRGLRDETIFITDWQSILAIREIVNAAEIAEVKRLEAKLDALTGG